MKEFIDKLIERLEEESSQSLKDMIASKSNAGENFNSGMAGAFNKTIAIVNQLAEEYNNDFCEWEYDDFEDGWQTSCGTTFSLCDSDKEITHYCPCCGKKIKVAPYTEGE